MEPTGSRSLTSFSRLRSPSQGFLQIFFLLFRGLDSFCPTPCALLLASNMKTTPPATVSSSYWRSAIRLLPIIYTDMQTTPRPVPPGLPLPPSTLCVADRPSFFSAKTPPNCSIVPSTQPQQVFFPPEKVPKCTKLYQNVPWPPNKSPLSDRFRSEWVYTALPLRSWLRNFSWGEGKGSTVWSPLRTTAGHLQAWHTRGFVGGCARSTRGCTSKLYSK
jgi:hypothetical protein